MSIANRMIGKFTQVCRMSNCRCGNAHDSKGRRMERRHVKRIERRKWRNNLTTEV